MRRAVFAFLVATMVGGGTAGGLAACSSGSGGGSPSGSTDASTLDHIAADAGNGLVPQLACTDTIDSVYADPGDVSAKPKGSILKCAHDRDLTAAELMAEAQANVDGGDPPYAGRPFTSGAHLYRVLYRTERGDDNAAGIGSPGYSSALLLLPEKPRLGAGEALPAIVAAHGSRGQAGKCAPSRFDPAGDYVKEDFLHLVYPLVGLGYPVIAPDYAGYANFGGANNPPPTYSHASDIGKSMLDGARAIRNLLASSDLTDQTVIAGHSQGGFAALSTLAMSDRYGGAGTGVISAVALYAPLWFSQRGWGAVFAEPSSEAFSKSAGGIVSTLYHYTESYLLDGPDAALELFNPSKAAAVQAFVDNDCWAATYPDLMEAGASANDLFSSTYINAITNAALPPPLGSGGNCGGSALCQTWIDRMTADYPHLDGGASKVPIALVYAAGDTTITPDLMQCVFNRLSTDGTDYQICYDTDPVGHPGSVADNADWVADWIASKTIADAGAPGAGHCTSLAPNEAGVPQLLNGSGSPVKCSGFISSE